MTDKQPRNRAGRLPRRKRRAFGKGSKERFVKLDFWMLTSEAWDALSPGASRLLIEVWARHNGQNNGRISYSLREAVEKLRVSKDTASKWFHELEVKGFLKARQRGSFNYKKRHASEWILTAEPYKDERPTKDFMRWKPEKQIAVLARRTDGPSQKDRGTQQNPSNEPDGPAGKDREAVKPPPDGPAEKDTYNLPRKGCSAGQVVQSERDNVAALPPIPPFLDRRRKPDRAANAAAT